MILVKFAAFIILPRECSVLLDPRCESHSSFHFSVMVISSAQQLFFENNCAIWHSGCFLQAICLFRSKIFSDILHILPVDLIKV